MNWEQTLSGDARLDADGFRNKLNPILGSQDYNFAVRRNKFSCSLESVRLGELDVLRYSGYGLRGLRRRFAHIRESTTDDFLVAFSLTYLADPIAISQSGELAVAESGTCVLIATNRPYETVCGSSPGHRYAGYLVRIPGPLLRQHIPHIDECCVRPIAMQHGAGKILLSLIESLVECRNDYSESQAGRFGEIVLNTFVNIAVESPELVKFQRSRREPAHSRIFECAKTFIESNLSNPKLDPAMVADHCRVTVRYLHAAFAASSRRVGAYIREMRLQRCREALQSPLLRNQSIIETAMRWGFNSAPSFNRAYRAQFGKSPSEEKSAHRKS